MKIRVDEISFVVAFCIIILIVYSTGCYDKCLKNREHQKLFLDAIYGVPYWVDKKYIVLFPEFKYKVDSFNLYIIDNYVNPMLPGFLNTLQTWGRGRILPTY